MKIFVTAFALCAASTAICDAEASTVGTDVSYAIDLHYSSEAFGKSVHSVVAHVGLLTQHPPFAGKPDTWQNVKDVQLLKGTNGFTGRTGLRGQGSSGSYAIELSPVVVYFVKFKDASSSISPTFSIKSEFNRSNRFDIRYQAKEFLAAAQNLLQHLKQPEETSVRLEAINFEWDANGDFLTETLIQSGIQDAYPN
ncbi:MAG: hypothetical protein IOD12_16805 [Silvanigrellales bacterium]|jgi:hypothetical protein|nr:hypothetical protein [Silvanigrellales bacterium]